MNSPVPEVLPGNPLDAWAAAGLGIAGEQFTRVEIESRQWMRLAETVAWAKAHSPFYRRRLDNVDENALASVEALRRLPFTTADDLRRNDPSLLCVSQSEISRIVTLDTSGTSGPPKRLFFTPEDQEATIDFFRHGMSVFTRPGDRVAILFPGERPGSVGDLLAQGLRRLGAEPIPVGWPQDLAATAKRLRDERPDVVAGTPVAVLAVARHGAASGPLHVPRVLLSADHAAPSLRASLAELWDCEIFEHYGMTEMGLGGGVDCAAHDGYHMRDNELLVEIVDPASDAALAPGQFGEVVVSTLMRRGLPLIRYRTGDVSRVLPGPCACGSPLTRLDRIRGRLDAGVETGAGLLTMPTLDEALFAQPEVVDFSATWRGTPAQHLDLDISCLPGTGDPEVLRTAVIRIPVLARAVGERNVRLTLTVSGAHLHARAGKRRIAVDNAA